MATTLVARATRRKPTLIMATTSEAGVERKGNNEYLLILRTRFRPAHAMRMRPVQAFED
jgi:hypothetical protein